MKRTTTKAMQVGVKIHQRLSANKRGFNYPPIPKGPTQAPLMRLKKVRDGVIGFPWVEVLAILPGHTVSSAASLSSQATDPESCAFHSHREGYLCRVPTFHGKTALAPISCRDLFGDGANEPEYEEAP